VAVLLHVAAIVLFILIARQKPPEEAAQSPPGVSVVFQNGGAPQTAAPPAPLRGPSTPAQAPQQPPPPPPQAALEQPEVNLNMPQMPFAEVPSAPAPPAPAAPRPRPRPAPPQHYVVMNGMSYGNPSPPLPNAQQAMNLSLPMSDAQAVNAPELTIKGEIGADWEAELDKWVNEHKYYPQAALEQDQQGNVQIEFTVDRAGNVTGLHMLGSSGSTFLDQAWLGLFGDNTLPPFPAGTKADHITVDATMHYELIQ
jgi:protein TonB